MRYTIHFALAAIALTSIQLAGCEESSTYTKVEPAEVEHKEGEAISKLTLTEKAMERLDLQTATVKDGKAEGAPAEGAEAAAAGIIVPYSSIIYVPTGETFVYTSPEPRVFIRQLVEVDRIEGDMAVLKTGPAAGTQVASVGASELLGTEFGVGH
jgi:hypothetical protein